MLRSLLTGLLFFLIGGGLLRAQRIEMLTTGTPTSLRGMSVVNDSVIWVSGSSGMIGRSTNGGNTWQWTQVPGFEQREFRDIHAFDKNTAIAMAIAEPANIIKTSDGGLHWKTVFTDSTKGMFLDAMDFADKKNGIVVGDPIQSKFFLARTSDKGDTWKLVAEIIRPDAEKGEACFAASGTNIKYFKDNDFLFVSGGSVSRLHDDAGGRRLPLLQGGDSKGANSIATRNTHSKAAKHFIIVGGDFLHDQDTTGNCILTDDGGNTWIHPATPPHGYRSCVIYLSNKKLVTCGISGVDISFDSGKNWRQVTTEGFHVCQKARKGKNVFLAGSKGRVAKLVF